ncbi:hypothetical protein PHYPSEUDO_009463 [Phytophthora pseudosyringae]|uniref:Uncharacterized protein n=1 Tax=Phytophthora pseudosyringae TaxID=221518 RepID=A0A8T1VFC3_9STRA|nr:hypothetical protein PHYPSEUDO_009463 [Phytophthora pseudosyringae]
MASRQAGEVPSQPKESKHATIPTGKTPIGCLQMHAEQRSRLLDEYFESTKLLQAVQDFMASLASTYKTQLRLPANPYPDLLKTIRMHELGRTFTLHSNCSDTSPLALTVLSGQASTPPQFQVCRVEHEQFALAIWGTKPTLELLTGTNLYGLLEVVNTAFQGLVIYKEFTDDDCQATAYGVLVGNGVLGARVQDLQPCFLELETHVFVSGVHLEKTMTVFARFLLKQLHETAHVAADFSSLPPEEAADYSGCVACDGITITPLSSSEVELSPEDAVAAVWSIDRVKESRAAFINAVKTALVSNSLITLNRYDSVKLSNFDGGYMSQVEQTFFFHFAVEGGSKPTDSKSVKSTVSRRSFLTGSRALAAGIFFHSQGALEVAARFRTAAQTALEEEERKKESQKKKQGAVHAAQSFVIVPRTRLRTGFVGILQETVDELRRIGLSSEVYRQQANYLVWCFAYSLGYLVGAHQVLEGVLCHFNRSAAMTVKLQACFAGLGTQMKRFLEESDASKSTSVLHPIRSLIRQFYREVNYASAFQDERQPSEFVETLRCVNELLLQVVRIVFSDFIRLVRTTVVLPVDPATTNTEMHLERPTTLDEIDVPRALEMAVEERKYPSAIVSEAIFAQAIVDCCLDVALESAVMNTVAIRLPPNPFIDMSSNLQVFALRQLVWRRGLQSTAPKSITKIATHRSLDLFSAEGISVCAANPKLLELVGGDQIIEVQRWLTDRHVFHEDGCKPSRGSYSVAIIPVLLVFHPLLFANARSSDIESSPCLEEIDTLEQYVLEGKEFAQARLFFVEAVRSDLRRISSSCASSQSSKAFMCWQLRAKACVLDSHGQVVIELDLSPMTTDDILAGIIEEATQAQFLLHVAIEIVEVQTQDGNSITTLRKVTKAYAFHHHPTDKQDAIGPSTLLSPLVRFRVSEYGVFFSKENALLCLQSMELPVHVCQPQGSGIPRDDWTPYASEALHYNDSFLIYELNIVHNTQSWGSLQQDWDSELTKRLILYSDICELYSVEQALRWLLNALQVKLQQLIPSQSRKEDVYSDFPPATVFNIHHRLALQIIAQMERLVVPLNHQLHFLQTISEPLAVLRKCVARWKAIQPPTEELLELLSKQQEKTPEVLPTPREDPVIITSKLVESLRTTWVLVLFFRLSYQRAFFANGGSRRGR